MENNSIFRLALMCSNSQASTFITNLKKLVQIVLHDNYGKGLKLTEISNEIKTRYDIEFSTKEILAAIEKDKNDTIIIFEENEDHELVTYSLSAKEYQKDWYNDNRNIDYFVRNFINENSEYASYNQELISSSINKFFYKTFNDDVNTVSKLINAQYSKIDMNQEDYSVEEAEIINAFLNWDNEEKNRFVLEVISACFDYCMLTVKKDSSSYKDIFNNKVFYLDANVIFRLAGFNKSERQSTIKLFVDKCLDSGIKLKYTNCTYDEIKRVIHDRVEKIKKIIKNNEPISVGSFSTLLPKYANLNFYELYLDWTHNKRNKYGDFESFEKYLIAKIDDCLKPFSFSVVKNYKNLKSKKEDFEDYFESYKEFKQGRYKKYSDSTIETDVNNYIFINDLNQPLTANSFLEIQNYFITADHSLTDWAIDMNPGTIPFFVLPSVWYSVLLKYKGRNKNDYFAFTQFLSVRMPVKQEDDNDKLRSELLAIVMDLNDSRDVKETVVRNINDDLIKKNVEIPDPYKYVEKKHAEVTQQKVDEAVAKEKANAKETITSVAQHERSIAKEKVEEAVIKERKKSKQKEKDAFKSGENKAYTSIATQNIASNKRKLNIIYGLILFGIGLIIAVIIIKMFGNASNNKFINFIEARATIIAVIIALVDVAIAVIGKICNLNGYLNTNIEKEIEKLKK